MQVNTNQPSSDYKKLKLALNEEFIRKAQIQGLVSYIYYPSTHYIFGHSEVEVEGRSWTLMRDFTFGSKSLSRMIQSSKSGRGYSFFRFDIAVTPNQLIEMRENVWKIRSIICSHGALRSLSRYGKYSVPLPLTITPFISAAYLMIAKKMGSKRIKQIQFFGCESESKFKNLIKCIPGIFVELVALASVISYPFTE